jgi:hypothetical protein
MAVDDLSWAMTSAGSGCIEPGLVGLVAMVPGQAHVATGWVMDVDVQANWNLRNVRAAREEQKGAYWSWTRCAGANTQ